MDIKELKKLENDYVLKVFSPSDVCFVRGNGTLLYDNEGKEYLDFLSGIAVCSLGHSHPKLTKAIAVQSKKLIHISNYFYNEYRGTFAMKLIKNTHFGKVFFSNSGAEANECALKAVKKFLHQNYPERTKIVTALNSFHGRTLATVTATGQEKYYQPFSPVPDWFIYVPFNDIHALEMQIKNPTVGAVMLETIQGEGGVIVADINYIRMAEKLCKKYDKLLIIDEVQTGMMRTGKMFSYQHYNIKPDIVTLAKGIGGGYPLGATLLTERVANSLSVGDHGTTFGSSPLAMAVGICVINELKKSAMKTHIDEVSDYFMTCLKEMLCFPCVVSIRGKGFLLGLELKSEYNAAKVADIFLQNGVVIRSAGHNTLRLAPALIVTKDDIDKLILIMKNIFEELK